MSVESKKLLMDVFTKEIPLEAYGIFCFSLLRGGDFLLTIFATDHAAHICFPYFAVVNIHMP